MERRISGGRGGVVVVLVALVMLANGVNAQIYTCWGGCYNDCFLRGGKTLIQKLACYYICLPTCVHHSPADHRYYCRVGCSLEQCSPLHYTDDGRMETCFGKCGNLCN